MLSVTDAEKIILELIEPLGELETVELNQARGRILASSIQSNLDFPHWDNSAMDGYAVRYADVVNTEPDHPVALNIVGEISAGKVPNLFLNSGEAARIFTGAMLPEGADTIVMQENTQLAGDRVFILAAPSQPGAFVRRQGEYYTQNTHLLGPGIRLNPAEIAVLATMQVVEVPVYRQPRVAILSTGDELVNPEATLQPGQIVDSNQYALTTFVLSQGAIPMPLGIVPDQPQMLRAKIRQAIENADIVLSTGGVSVGSYDYVESILSGLGANIAVNAVAIKPGKPLTVARFDSGCLYFGIPGNPVSALVSCWRFVQPALNKLSGLSGDWLPPYLEGITTKDLTSQGTRETYLWGNLSFKQGIAYFDLAFGSHSSANLINLAKTNALAVIPSGTKLIQSGSKVKIMPLNFPL